MSDINKLWPILKSSSMYDVDIQKAFERAATPNACIELLEDIDTMQSRIKELEKALGGVIASPHTKLSEGVLLEVRQSDIDAAIKAINSAKAGKASSKAVSNIAEKMAKAVSSS